MMMKPVTSKRTLTDREILVEKLRWEKFPCLDDGFICLVDVMGEDTSIVQAARVSYGEGTKTPSDDRTLIRYLMRKRHTTPFEMCELKFLVRVPMDCWRQWIRHRMANVNEYSTRYSLAIDSQQRTDSDKWRLQAENRKQGSAGFVTEFPDSMDFDDEEKKEYWHPGEYLTEAELRLHLHTRQVYQDRIEFGVAREQARKDLPLSTYTEAYWKIDLHNLLHFLGLRMDSHAQEEIRTYANCIGKIVKQLFPITWEAFEDYRLNATGLSALDIHVIQTLSRVAEQKIRDAISNETFTEALAFDCSPPYPVKFFLEYHGVSDWNKQKCSERDECVSKLQLLELLEES